MDVRCGRCGTEYEFDDALISERGTTVKCTNCGHQFKVFPDAAAAAPERWIVRTAAGRELVYTTLRDLQRGIAKGQVGPNDILSRGDRPPRPLSSIAELEPFLKSAQATAGPIVSTLAGVAPAANSSQGSAGPLSGLQQADAGMPASQPPLQSPALNATVPVAESRPLGSHDENANPASGAASLHGTSQAVAPGGPRSEAGVPASATPSGAAPGPNQPASGVRAGFHDEPQRGGLEAARVLLQHDDQTDPQYSPNPPARRARSRWVVAIVLLGAGGLLAATVGRRYLAQYERPASEPAVHTDSRVESLLAEGEQRLDDGDLERASEAFAKASVLADKHPEVLTALARLALVRADLLWLKLKLLNPDDGETLERARRELADKLKPAQHALTTALAAAPAAESAQRLALHEKRLSGKLDQARREVGVVSKDPALPENAYALAALDMAEPTPAWSSVIHRLRSAAAAEGGLGLARAALVYALAQSGDSAEARAELDKLRQANASHPLAHDLQQFLQRHADEAPDAGEPLAAAGSDEDREPDSDAAAQQPDETSGDFRAQLKQAYAALQDGDLGRAERLYDAVLDKHPGNTEALAGLADVANRKNDTSRASALYEQVLAKNPSYLPALIASADQKWAAGDKQGALKLYRRIVDQAGADSAYGQRAARRIAEAGSAERPASTEDTPREYQDEAGDSEATDSNSPEDDQPHIDTTDLPEFNQ